MKSLLIQILETICPNKVFLQGTLNPDVAYPDEFITFWTNYTDDNAHYDNSVESVDWNFSVIFYSNNPDRVASVPAVISAALKTAGFIPQGKGNDVLSDVPTHTGWAMEFIFIEYLSSKTSIVKLAPYLYKALYKDIDYQAGFDYYERFKPVIGACSAVSNGNYLGRNYDWHFDEKCSFVVYTPAAQGRHSVLGVCAGTEDLTQQFIDSGAKSESYDVVPFRLMDGINDAGLVCEINVVPTDNGITFGTDSSKEDLFALMIPRYVLDYAASVDEAIALIRNRNVFCAYTDDYKQEFHFMLKDSTKTAVVEFIQNEINVIETFVDDKPIMTNLFLTDYDGTRESLTPYAMGIERQAILHDNYAMSETEFGMISLMQLVQYTKAYAADISPLWYSEFCGDYGELGNLTKDSTPAEYAPIMQIAREMFAERTRNGETWQTVHTSVYDLQNKKLTIIPQETGNIFSFTLKN